MRTATDDRAAKQSIELVLNKTGFEIISFRGIDEGDYWVHIRREEK
jgi:hypothetical protein